MIYENIVRSYRCSNNFEEGIKAAEHYLRFFPSNSILKEELALMYYYSNIPNYYQNLQKGLKLLNEIERSKIDLPFMKRVQDNKTFFVRKIKEMHLKEHTFPKIKIALCIEARPDSHPDSLGSFLSKCDDKQLISEWFCLQPQECLDANQLHQFHQFHNVTRENLIEKIEALKVTHVIYLEKECEFIISRSYITDMINILESSGANVGKISFNSDSSLIQRTKDGQFFCYNDQPLWSSGLMKKSMLLGSGNCYKTISLPGQHIEYRSEKQDFTPNYESITVGTFNRRIKYKTFVINLDRRQDRMKKIEDQKPWLPQYERISAIDGQQLKITKRLRSFCRYGNYKMRAGVIGCALSHLKLYVKLLGDEEHDGYVIFEDDIVVDDTFLEKFNKVFDIFESRNTLPSLLYFTTTYNRNYIEQTKYSEITKKRFHEMNFTIGGTGCYFISKIAARKAIEWIEKNTLNIEIDNILFRLANELDVYFVIPRICLSPECDTDIQNDFGVQSRLFEENLKDEDYSPFVLYNEQGDIDLFENLEI